MHSRVSQQSGIAFSGGEYEESFVLADVRMEWPLSRDEVTLFYSPKGLVVVAPLPERFRIVATVEERRKFRRGISCRRCSTSDVVALTDRMTRMATMKSPTGKALRNVAVMLAGHLPPVRAAVGRTLAELDAR
jgi:2-polyprenyl-6-methoxyphenol hydroxylase-like FAD-dependent oxidoreductase